MAISSSRCHARCHLVPVSGEEADGHRGNRNRRENNDHEPDLRNPEICRI